VLSSFLSAILVTFSQFPFSSGQTPSSAPPQLQAIKSAYEQQKASLMTQVEVQAKSPRDRYGAALVAAQKSATAAARTADLAAISGELDAVRAGMLPESAPPDLPKSLLQDRRAAAQALAAAMRTLTPRKRDMATAYVRNLAALEQSARRAKDQPLLDAIAAERERAMAEVESAGGGQKHENVVENGDFSRGPESGIPEGWGRAHTWKDVTDCSIVSDGRDRFLRFRRLQANNQSDISPAKTIAVPARARSAEVTFRMRVEGLVKGMEFDPWPGVHLSASGAREEKLGKEEAVLKADSSGWKRFSARLDLPKGSTNLKVSLGPFGAAGIIDFDDVAVEFK
jgi:hypothetical protein